MTLTPALADVLLRSTPALAVHWLDRIAAALPRAESVADPAPDAPAVGLERAERVIDAIVRALGAGTLNGGEIGADALTLAGWEYGVAAHAHARALHDLLQDFDLLLAILLHESEQAVGGNGVRPANGADGADAGAASLSPTAADAFRAARRLHEAVALASLAAAAGHAQETTAALRGRFRTLRHDLRNPLSTIQNVVSMMEDVSMPAETRHDPRYTGMLHRNAEALGDLIARELGEGGVGAGSGVRVVAVSAVALAVRRSLREDLRASDIEIEIDAELPVVTVDATAVALALRALLAAAIRAVPSGSTLSLHALAPDEAPPPPADMRRARPPRPMLRLVIGGPFVAPPEPVDAEAGPAPDDAPQSDSLFAAAVEVASRVGGTVQITDGRLALELPVVRAMAEVR